MILFFGTSLPALQLWHRGPKICPLSCPYEVQLFPHRKHHAIVEASHTRQGGQGVGMVCQALEGRVRRGPHRNSNVVPLVRVGVGVELGVRTRGVVPSDIGPIGFEERRY